MVMHHSKIEPPRSEGVKADIGLPPADVRFAPKADIAPVFVGLRLAPEAGLLIPSRHSQPFTPGPLRKREITILNTPA